MQPRCFLYTAVLMLVLGGCAVGPDYRTPAVAVPERWAANPTGAAAGTNVALSQWWQAFHDPALEALLARAMGTNLEVRLAEARIRQARAQLGVAGAAFGPTLDAQGSYARQKQSQHQPILGSIPLSPNIPFENNVFQAGFDASWELDLFGGTRRGVEAARADLAATGYGRAEVLVSVLAEVGRHYALARGTQRELALARDQIRAQAEAVAIIRNRVEHGVAPELDLARALALDATLRAQVPAIETAIEASLQRLAVLLDESVEPLRPEFSTAAPLLGSPPVVPVGLPSELLRRRPDLRRAERQLAAATARIGQARAERFPKFALTGAAGVASVSAGDLFVPGSRTWSIGPSVKWRLFDLGRVRAEIQAQTAVRDEAALSYEQVVLQAFEEVENALVAYAKEQEHHQVLGEALAADRRALELARQLYDKGLGHYLDVLDAQRTLFAAEDEVVRSERAIAINLIALYKALGGGWEAGG